MNIVISHVYSRHNKGDAALTSVLIADLRRTFPEAQLTILALQPDAAGTDFEGVPERAAFMSYVLNNSLGARRKLARAVYLLGATPVWAVWYRLTGRQLHLPQELHTVARHYTEADLVVPVGGGHIRGQKKGLAGLFNLPLLMQPLWFSYLLGKPTVLYPQSVGPFQNRFEEQLAAITLRRMNLILLREDTSLALLSRLGVRRNTARAIDSAFLLDNPRQADLRQRYGIARGKLIVGVTVRSWLGGARQDAYETAVAGALDALARTTAFHMLFIPQVTAAKGDDDRVASRRVHERMRYRRAATVLDSELDHYELKALYGGLDLLVGTRFHSVIFALTSYVPVLAIEYEHKTSGIMHDLGLDEWVMKIEDVTAAGLTAKLQALLARQDEYTVQLQRRMPAYVERAGQTAGMLERSYAAATAAHSGAVPAASQGHIGGTNDRPTSI